MKEIYKLMAKHSGWWFKCEKSGCFTAAELAELIEIEMSDADLAEKEKQSEWRAQALVAEFKKEMEYQQWMRDSRIEYLLSVKNKLNQQVKKMFGMSKQSANLASYRDMIANKQIIIAKIMSNIENLRSWDDNKISDIDIENARNYSLDKLLDIKKNFALCINHQDTKPSMYCKKNFAHCFVCGWTGSAIDVVMKLEGLDFVAAVKRLNE